MTTDPIFISLSNAQAMFLLAVVVTLAIFIIALVAHLRSKRKDTFEDADGLSGFSQFGPASIDFSHANSFLENPHSKAVMGKDLVATPTVGDLNSFR
tara:strand:+ start:2618 stop:2908 length:291 start_codon:yes stop_codon:yes gene_type:complete